MLDDDDIDDCNETCKLALVTVNDSIRLVLSIMAQCDVSARDRGYAR